MIGTFKIFTIQNNIDISLTIQYLNDIVKWYLLPPSNFPQDSGPGGLESHPVGFSGLSLWKAIYSWSPPLSDGFVKCQSRAVRDSYSSCERSCVILSKTSRGLPRSHSPNLSRSLYDFHWAGLRRVYIPTRVLASRASGCLFGHPDPWKEPLRTPKLFYVEFKKILISSL